MKKLFSRLSLKQELALLGFTLGFVALFAGDPYHSGVSEVNAKELALIVEREVDHVNVDVLADWIIQGRSDYRLIDLRNEKDYSAYHIPSAENVTLSGLEHTGLKHNEKIILYSDGGIHSAQAWMLLRATGFAGVYILRGGLEEWKDRILFPRVPVNPTPAQMAEYARIKEISKYFGGSPQGETISGKKEPVLATPKLELPAPTTTVPKASAGKKKKEGC